MTKAELNAFLKEFKLTSTGKADEVGSTDVKRKALAHYIRKAGQEAFEMLGYKQESSAVSSNYDTAAKTDVTGVTYNDINGKAEAIDLSEYRVNPKKTVFLEEAIKLKLSDQEEDMHDYEILTVYGFLRNTDNNGDDGSSDDDLRKTKEWLEEILPLVVAIGAGFATWKITNLLKEADLLSGKLSISITLIAVGATLLAGAAINWKEGLHDGENTLNSVLGTIGTIALVIGLIIAGVVAWPVLLIGGLIILGMWYDNFKNDVDSWIASLPNGIYELVDIIVIASYGVWDFLKNLFKGLYEIFTGDWEKGLKRIGIAFVNLFVDILNIIIQLVNFIISALTAPFKAGWNLGQEIISWIAGDDYKKISTPEWLEWRIPKCPRIPQLATGMILPGGSPMLAWVNDQPKGQPYLEGSVENIAAAFDEYLGGRSFGNQNVNLIAKGPLAPLIRLLAFEIQNENERVSVF